MIIYLSFISVERPLTHTSETWISQQDICRVFYSEVCFGFVMVTSWHSKRKNRSHPNCPSTYYLFFVAKTHCDTSSNIVLQSTLTVTDIKKLCGRFSTPISALDSHGLSVCHVDRFQRELKSVWPFSTRIEGTQSMTFACPCPGIHSLAFPGLWQRISYLLWDNWCLVTVWNGRISKRTGTEQTDRDNTVYWRSPLENFSQFLPLLPPPPPAPPPD